MLASTPPLPNFSSPSPDPKTWFQSLSETKVLEAPRPSPLPCKLPQSLPLSAPSARRSTASHPVCTTHANRSLKACILNYYWLCRKAMLEAGQPQRKRPQPSCHLRPLRPTHFPLLPKSLPPPPSSQPPASHAHTPLSPPLT